LFVRKTILLYPEGKESEEITQINCNKGEVWVAEK
jgi:hypothetical protein